MTGTLTTSKRTIKLVPYAPACPMPRRAIESEPLKDTAEHCRCYGALLTAGMLPLPSDMNVRRYVPLCRRILVVHSENVFSEHLAVYLHESKMISAKLSGSETLTIGLFDQDVAMHAMHGLTVYTFHAAISVNERTADHGHNHVAKIVNDSMERRPDLSICGFSEGDVILMVPYEQPLEYIIQTNDYQFINQGENYDLCRDVLKRRLSDDFVKDHLQNFHQLLKNITVAEFQIQVFRHIARYPEFHTLKIAKIFRLYPEDIDAKDLKQVCLYITRTHQHADPAGQPPFDKDELQKYILQLIHDPYTWFIDYGKEEMRGMIGIICNYLHMSPYDRLNGSFETDRIVLYTKLLLTMDVGFYEQLLRHKSYLAYSILNDMPGFGSYFFNKQCLVSYEELQSYVEFENGEGQCPACDGDGEGSTTPTHRLPSALGHIQNYTVQQRGFQEKYPFVYLVFKMLREHSMSPQIQLVRSAVKLIDALMHSYFVSDLYMFICMTTIHWLNFLYSQMAEQSWLTIIDALRLSGSVQSLFLEFSQVQDHSMTRILSRFVCALYRLAQRRIFGKERFSIHDKTLPVGFEGGRAIVAYVNDLYEYRSVSDLHILAQPGQCHVYSLEQVRRTRIDMDSIMAKEACAGKQQHTTSALIEAIKGCRPRKSSSGVAREAAGNKNCVYCSEWLPRILCKLVALNSNPGAYYFDNQLSQRDCPFCNGKVYHLSSEDTFSRIVREQNVYEPPAQFSDQRQFKYAITHFINIDNSMQQLISNYNQKINLRETVHNLRICRRNVKDIMNTDSYVINQLNDLSEVVERLEDNEACQLGFNQQSSMIQLKVNIDETPCYDSFATQDDTRVSPHSSNRSLNIRERSLNKLRNNEVIGDCEDMPKQNAGASQNIPLRVYIIDRLSIEAALVSILRALLKSQYNIFTMLQKPPTDQDDAYSLFYTNEQILGKPMGLPSLLSLCNNKQQFTALDRNQYYDPELNRLFFQRNRRTSRDQFEYFLSSLDGSVIQNYIANFSNDLLVRMLAHAVKQVPLRLVYKNHYKQYFQNVVCRLFEAVQLDDSTEHIINEILVPLLIDKSDTSFKVNWFTDTFKNERNRNIHKQIMVQIDQRKSSWPEIFELDTKHRSYNSGGLGYVPFFQRHMSLIRDLLFGGEQLQTKKSIFYQMEQVRCNSRVVVVQRYHCTDLSLQAMTISALMGKPSVLPRLLLGRDRRGRLLVKHISLDSAQVLINGGELWLLINWLSTIYGDLLMYMNASNPQDGGYDNFVQCLIGRGGKPASQQPVLACQQNEYYVNTLTEIGLSIYFVLSALIESNSMLSVPALFKIAALPRGQPGDPIVSQFRAQALLQLKILLQVPLKIRTVKCAGHEQLALTETYLFNNNLVAPLVSRIRYGCSCGVLEKAYFVRINPEVDILRRYHNSTVRLNFAKAVLRRLEIKDPQCCQARDQNGQNSCELIVDNLRLDSCKRAFCIVGDHQVYFLSDSDGRQRQQKYIGAVSLVNAVVYLADYQRHRIVLLRTKYPWESCYCLISYNNDIDELYVSIMGAIL